MSSSLVPLLGDLSPILSFFAWWFLPGLFSGLVLGFFYRLRPSWRPLYPQASSGTPDQKNTFNPIFELQKLEVERKNRLHRSVAHGFVISIYLIYTLVNVYRSQAGTNYYTILGLKSNSLSFNLPLPGSTPPPSVPKSKSKSKSTSKGSLLDEAGFKSHWRKLARSFHPDKLNPPQHLHTEEDISKWRDDVQSKFIDMREAYETLSDDNKQWAYDRFGPNVATWKNCVTMREYLLEGLKQSAPFWIFTLISLTLIGSIRKADPGAFWRWTCLTAILGSEFIILTSTSSTPISSILSRMFPNRAPFQQIELLRQIFIASSSITTQLSSILYPIPLELNKNLNLKEMLEPIFGLVERAQEASTSANVEVIKLIFNDLHPVLRGSNQDVLGSLNVKSGPSSSSAAAAAESMGEGDKTFLEDNRVVSQIIDDLKLKMLDTFCDLKLQSDPNGQAAWIQAIHEHN